MARAALALAFALTLIVGADNASAVSMNYGDFSGANVSFEMVTESSVTDPLPLYGAPSVVGDSLQFFPTTFFASASGGASDTTDGSLTMRITADAGQFLTVLTIAEDGDYQLAGGGANTDASVTASLDVTDVMGVHGTISDSASRTFQLGVDPNFANFSNVFTVDLTGLGITSVDVAFSNSLVANSEPTSIAFIQKKVISGPMISVQTGPVVPEPTAFLVFGLGLAVVGAATRRMRLAPAAPRA